ncbi:MAG TPA: DUF222 domain-containing protein [Streptosporangiaceae bacterium]|nr:DUF222 domain-containing protein [Streptosporangiaceae bacterium]
MAPDGDGLRWSFELDLVSALEAIGRPLRDWDGVDQEEDLAAEIAALGFTDGPPEPGLPGSETGQDLAGFPPGPHFPDADADAPARRAGADLAGAVAEALPAGPGLAAWLSGQDPAAATGRDLVGMAGAFRRVASWAQARELELIAHVAARSAAADPKAGLAPDGRPAHVTDDAAAQVSLELALSRVGAEAWAGLAVALRWRLPATAAALAEGRIDTYRAKILAEAVIPLSDDAARIVEDRVIPDAGDLTYGQVHAAVRRAVIAADPEGAEHRRQAAERRAKVSLYADQDGTATLAGYCLPAPEAAAAYARISAIANAMKAAGAGGGIHFLRAQVLLGKILDTLPIIPPPPGSPPDAEPPSEDDDGWTPPGSQPPPDNSDGGGPPDNAGPPGGGAPPPDVPPLTDADLPEDDGYRDTGPPPPGGYADWDPARGDPLDDHYSSSAAQWPWPPIPPMVPAAAGTSVEPRDTGAPGRKTSSGPSGRPPPGGLLDLTLPWVTFIGTADAPATLGRIGPVTAPEARRLASLALRCSSTQWRIIVTDADRHAIAVTRLPRTRPPGGPEPPGRTGIIGRITIVVPADALDTAPAPAPDPRLTGGIYARLLTAARRARDRAQAQAAADRHAPGGCAHTTASPAYQPPPRIREYVAARDQTCRGPRCGQPAWRGDLDHTIAYDQGGRTCPCDLGAVCRRHHRLKQHPGWTLTQPQPGTFCWTTPAGRSYTTRPHQYYTG